MIDTHCHISSEDYDDIEKVILDNRLKGVSKVVVSLCSKESIREEMDIAFQYHDVYLTLGYHPEYADNITSDEIEELKDLLNYDKVVGIGEIGLDYHYGKDNIEEQKSLFKKQLEIASEFNLPVVIHSRDATNDTINILKEYSVSGIIHCFSGSLETAKMYIKMGYKLGIGGVVTFQNSKLGEVIKEISLDDIVLETDSPYLAPVPFRGKQNSSKYLEYIARKIAVLKEIDFNEVVSATTENANKIFKF